MDSLIRDAYFTASSNGNLFYVSDYEANRLICFDSTGSLVNEYSEGLENPRGLFVDTKGNSIICNQIEHSIAVVTAIGKHHKTLVSNNQHGISKTISVCLRPCDGTLVVGCTDHDELYAFTLSPLSY